MTGLALALTLAASVSQQPEPKPLFRTQVRRVLLDVFVTSDGRPVPGLGATDFEVFDNGARQENVVLLDAARLPLGAVLLLDASQSVQGAKLEKLRRAAHSFLGKLGGADAVAIVTFGTRYRDLQPFTEDYDAASRALGSLGGAGATSLLDSLFFSLLYAEESPGRPLVVLLSDGIDTASWLTAEDVIRAAERSETTVFAVRAGSGAGVRVRAGGLAGGSRFVASSSEALGARTLEDVTAATAGRVLPLSSRTSIESAFEAILEEMRNRYVLAYQPTDTTEGWHPLQVELRGKRKVELRARAGYYFR